MFFKIGHFIDKKHFGNQVVVYKGKNHGEDIYFLVIKDREEVVYFLVNENTDNWYPVNSLVNGWKINISFEYIPSVINLNLDIDLSKYGSSSCPQFIRKIINDAIPQS